MVQFIPKCILMAMKITSIRKKEKKKKQLQGFQSSLVIKTEAQRKLSQES